MTDLWACNFSFTQVTYKVRNLKILSAQASFYHNSFL